MPGTIASVMSRRHSGVARSIDRSPQAGKRQSCRSGTSVYQLLRSSRLSKPPQATRGPGAGRRACVDGPLAARGEAKKSCGAVAVVRPACWCGRCRWPRWVPRSAPKQPPAKFSTIGRSGRNSAKVIPNLKTVVVHCFDPRVTGGIPTAVAKALPGQIYPEEVFEFVGEGGKKNMGSNTTIFPVVVAGGRASASAQLSISIACHLFDIDLTRHTRACKCLWLSVRHRNWRTASRRGQPRRSECSPRRRLAVATHTFRYATRL